jgi:hypothetical protein
MLRDTGALGLRTRCAPSDNPLRETTMSKRIGDVSRRRRFDDPARSKWYAHWRSIRFARRFGWPLLTPGVYSTAQEHSRVDYNGVYHSLPA